MLNKPSRQEIIEKARYCALITLNESGHPQARTMDPFLPTENMHVWMGTNKGSRKVREIQNDPRVSLYYASPDDGAYVVITGNAVLVCEVVPEKLEIISYKHGITSVSNTWEVPHLEF